MSETWQIVWSIVGVIVGIFFLILCILFVAKPWPSKKPIGEPLDNETVWHALPAMRGDGSLPCCGRYPDQVPGHDRLTPNPHQVTCGRIAGQPRRAT